MKLDVAVSKIGKYATDESGDTLEMVERPHGGISFVLVDGQRSGRGAKRISNIVARKAINLLAEGVRDGAVARAAHDYLYTHRQGQVSATLNVASVDMVSRTLVLSRNNHCPIYILTPNRLTTLDEESTPVGIYRNTKPVVTELPLEAPTAVIIFTDGVQRAGRRYNAVFDMPALLKSVDLEQVETANSIAGQIFTAACNLDQNRPADDISLLVIAILDRMQADNGRHMQLQFPL